MGIPLASSSRLGLDSCLWDGSSLGADPAQLHSPTSCYCPPSCICALAITMLYRSVLWTGLDFACSYAFPQAFILPRRSGSLQPAEQFFVGGVFVVGFCAAQKHLAEMASGVGMQPRSTHQALCTEARVHPWGWGRGTHFLIHPPLGGTFY